MNLLTASARAQLDALARKEVSAVELLAATVEQIERVNPALNAVVAMDADAARESARASDQRRREGKAGPLDGLPITIKDSFATKGLTTTSGAPVHQGWVPDYDAAAVARLRTAGAVIVGKTNVPLFTGDFQSFNKVYGTTNNPWDVERSPGGSSGGAAAAVAAGMSSFELGSDIGGSIRWPAHACGIFGLKTTYGLVSMRGHVPPAPGMESEADLGVGGPLARSAGDLDLILDVIAGPPDPAGIKPRLDPPRRTEARGLRVAVWLDEPMAPTMVSVADAVQTAARLLNNAGAHVGIARPAFDFAASYEVYSLMNHAITIAGLPEKTRTRLAQQAGDFAPGDLSHRGLQSRAAVLTAADFAALNERRAALKRAWDAFFQEVDVVLMPPAHVTAVKHDHRSDFHARVIETDEGTALPYFDFLKWSSLATVSHLPAAVAPILRSPSGLPAGVQIVAAEGADRTAIAVAGMLEQLTGGYVAPPLAAAKSAA